MPTARNAIVPLIDSLESRRHFSIDAAALPLSFGGPGFDNAQKVVATATGAIVTGLFSGTVDFDPTAGVTSLTARGDSDIYIASYNTNGTLNFAIQAGGDYVDNNFEDFKDRSAPVNPRRLSAFIGQLGELPREAGEYVHDLTVDAAGNIYIAGSFKDSITIGNRTLTADNLFNDDYHDALIVKVDPTGNVLWTRSYGGRFDDVALSLGLDAAGNLFVGGYYTRQADFDPSSRVHMLTTNGRDAGYVMRMSPEGALAWVYQFTSEATDPNLRNAVNDIAVTPSGNVYFVGTFADKADFDPSRKTYLIEAQDDTDAYLGMLNRKGQLNWALATGGDQADGNTAVAIGIDGGIYTGGYFSDEVDVDPRRNVTRIFTATPEKPGDTPKYTDLLVSRFAPTGEPVWQAQMGGEFQEVIADLQIGTDGSVYTLGSFYGNADFAPGTSQVILSSALVDGKSIKDGNATSGRNETFDWFVSRLSPRGKYIDATRIGGQDDDFASGLFVDGNRLYVAGRAVSTRKPDRDDRDETSLILLLDTDLRRLS